MNKFLILMVALVCIFKFSNAQTEKGSQTAGINLSYSGTRYNDNYFDNSGSPTSLNKVKNTQFTVGPLYSYFIADRVDVGASFSLTSYASNTTRTDISFPGTSFHNRSSEATVFVRKYFLYEGKIGIRTGPYAGYNWTYQGYGSGNGLVDPGVTNYRSHGYEAGAKLEAVYFPSKRLGVSAMVANLAYQHFTGRNFTNSGIERTEGDDVNIYFVNNLSLSLFYIFGK